MDFVNSGRDRSARAALVRKVRGWIEEAIRPRDDLDGNGDDGEAEDGSGSDSDDGLHGYTVLVQEMTCNIPRLRPD